MMLEKNINDYLNREEGKTGQVKENRINMVQNKVS